MTCISFGAKKINRGNEKIQKRSCGPRKLMGGHFSSAASLCSSFFLALVLGPILLLLLLPRPSPIFSVPFKKIIHGGSVPYYTLKKSSKNFNLWDPCILVMHIPYTTNIIFSHWHGDVKFFMLEEILRFAAVYSSFGQSLSNYRLNFST